MVEPAPIPANDWWRQFFDDDYASYGLAALADELNERTAAYLTTTLDLKPGSMVFDQCCGIGRVSIPLARRGVRTIGVDLVESYVETARRRTAAEDLPCEFHVGDAFSFICPEPCDAAINWFTSFGYTDNDERNRQMLQRAYDSLKPGGLFIMDYQNFARILSDFRPSIVERPGAPHLPEGIVVIQESKPDFERGMMESDWTVFFPDGRRINRRIAVRMYLPHTIADLLRQCGFEQIQLTGSFEGEPISLHGKRCLALARRPA